MKNLLHTFLAYDVQIGALLEQAEPVEDRPELGVVLRVL